MCRVLQVGLGHGITIVSWGRCGSVTTFRRIPHSHTNVETIGMTYNLASGKQWAERILHPAGSKVQEQRRQERQIHGLLPMDYLRWITPDGTQYSKAPCRSQIRAIDKGTLIRFPCHVASVKPVFVV